MLGVLEACFEGGAVAAVDRVFKQGDREIAGDLPGPVLGAVVDDDNLQVLEMLALGGYGRDGSLDGSLLVVGRNKDAYRKMGTIHAAPSFEECPAGSRSNVPGALIGRRGAFAEEVGR